MKIKDIADYLEKIAPLSLQESYDNAGLIVGDKDTEVTGVLLAIDAIEEVVDEAIQLKVNLIIAHHPIIFGGLKRLNGNNYIERTIIKAIKNNIAIYAAHTNLDSVIQNGVNTKICGKLGLQQVKILNPTKGLLSKIIVFVPEQQAEGVRQAMFAAGAGVVGNYDSCSFNSLGTGTFKGNSNSTPFVGKKGELHYESEFKVETIVPNHKINEVIQAMIKAHPYEEVAYDIIALQNEWAQVGAGMVGTLPEAMDEMQFLNIVKEKFNAPCLRYTPLRNKKVQKIAVCGGSGSFLLKNAIHSGADVFISGDFKYHQFFDADGKIIIADLGHFESEQFTKELFYELLTNKFANFAVHFTKVNTNPIKYL